MLDEIIDSLDESEGIPIGNYLSQYCGNFYLSELDHWLKETKRLKYIYRYMDDVVILHESKEFLHDLRREIDKFSMTNLKLRLKENWQVFSVDTRGIDFVGYIIFHDRILLRKRTCKNMKRRLIHILEKSQKGEIMNYSEFCTINSYDGWIRHCNSTGLRNKYVVPLRQYANNYYVNVIKKNPRKI